MRSSLPTAAVSWRVLMLAGVVLLIILMGIGALQSTTPASASALRAQETSPVTGLRGITQSPDIGTAYRPQVRDFPDPIYIATLPRSVGQASPSVASIPTSTPIP